MSSFWNEMYDVDHYRYGRAPNAFLAANASRLPEGSRVLCVGDGEGRNGVWLAKQGHDVTTIDASDVGVRKARELAAENDVTLVTHHGTFPTDLPQQTSAFDAVVLLFVHTPPDARRPFHRAAVQRLRQGGLILLEGFHPRQIARSSGGPRNSAMLFQAWDLAEDFADLRIAHIGEVVETLDEGPGHAGPAELIRLVGVKLL